MTHLTASAPTVGESNRFIAHAPRFAAVVGDAPALARLVDVDAHEGPVYAPDEHALYFTAVPRRTTSGDCGPEVAIKRVDLDDASVSVFRRDANVANGMALDREGQLVVCEQGTRSRRARIARIDRSTREVAGIVDSWRGVALNSPNDVVVRSDATLWFTDPGYGFLQGFRPRPQLGDYVYRYDPRSAHLSVVADSFDKPNGLAFSADERILYVSDSGANQEIGSYHPARPHHIKAFDVVRGRQLVNERLFAVVAPGFPDGLKVDAQGHVFTSSSSGVQVFDPTGDLIGEIELPGVVNFTFGGPDRNVLYVTTDDAIWAAHLSTTGPAD